MPHRVAQCFLLAAALSFGAEHAAASVRPGLITEQLFAPRSEQGSYDHRPLENYGGPPGPALVWHKALLDLDIATPPPERESWRQGDCNYDSAVAILEQIRRQAGDDTSYQKLWAANQDRVFSACDPRRSDADPPQAPAGAGLPARAISDFLYQQAGWHFYRGRFDHALALYRQIAAMQAAPLRPQAAYMVARTLAHLGRSQEAYDTVETILADQTLKPIHAVAANYRFVIMDPYAYGGQDITPELAERHLRWLVDTALISPEKAPDRQQAIADYFDAMEQLDKYFPVYDAESKAIDWWLRPAETTSPRMRAVAALSPSIELVDWMQAKWAYNVFDADWLWALHRPGQAYWTENRHIVLHAWERWRHGDGLEWLQIAARRVHPGDDLAAAIVSAAEPYLDRPWHGETRQYQVWLGDIWASLIRIQLGRGQYRPALSLIKDHADFRDLAHEEAGASDVHPQVLESVIRWLVYTGKFQMARQALALATAAYPDGFRQWRLLLAARWSSAVEAASRNERPDLQYDVGNDRALWYAIANRLSARALHALAADQTVDPTERPLLARAALTRAMLVGRNTQDIDRDAALAATLDPSIRDLIIGGTSGHDRDSYVGLLLEVPRLRPLAFLDYADPANDGGPVEATAIDTFNHNDNNGWCRLDRVALTDAIFRAARVLPIVDDTAPEVLGVHDPATDAEVAPYLAKQRKLLDRHPYLGMVDRRELRALAGVPSAPQFLTEAVLKTEERNRLKFQEPSARRDRIAADLQLSIRLTRYGCERNGSHAAYSRAAFERLHTFYADTLAAKATPYWFGCEHFRNGCNAGAAPQ